MSANLPFVQIVRSITEESNVGTHETKRSELCAGSKTLYEQLKSNDFREVENGMKDIREQMDRMDGRLREAREERRGIAAVVEGRAASRGRACANGASPKRYGTEPQPMKPYLKLAVLLLAAACSSDVISSDGAGPWGLEPTPPTPPANRAPVLSEEIPAQSFWAAAIHRRRAPREVLEHLYRANLDLSAYFTDPDGDTLTFAASSSDTAVVAVGFWPAGLWVVPQGAVGEAAVTVTATDPDSLEARAVFTVETTEHPDRAALVALYEATGGPGWRGGSYSDWLTDLALWNWHGVTVNRDGRVIELDLRYENLTGPIPPELVNLAFLEGLLFDGNALTGPIPPELANLASLERLVLVNNELTGPIPPELGNLASLRELNLSYNELTGPIPPELGNLASLEELDLGGYSNGGNNLTGPIPPELGNLANLEGLSLANNRLTGPIPPELGNLASLVGLGLGGNELTGPIPPELGNLASLEWLWLAGKLEGGGHAGTPRLSPNVLTGPIPPELGNLANLRGLTLRHSAVTGPIPPELGNLASLEELDLANNELTGPIPPELANLANLRTLSLAGNRDLCAPADPQFRAWLLDRRAIVSACRSNPDARLLPLALMRVDGNGMSLSLPQDLNGSAVSVSDPGVVAATLAQFRRLELVPLGIGRADVELVPSDGGSPAVATVAVREAVGTFGIDIVMEQPAPLGFEETMVEAADWWSSALDGTEWEDRTAHCSGYATATADELLIGAEHRAGPLTRGAVATARPCFRAVSVGDSTTLQPMGGRVTAGPWAVHDRDIMRHEIGHVLGLVGLTGLVTRDFATDRDWGHFIGPRAVEAYRAGGGDPDLPGVPLRVGTGAHWCAPGEIMSTCAGSWSHVSDGLSLAALADLGFTVDMTKATPWREWSAAAAAMGGEPFREVVEVRILPVPDPEPRR